MMMISQAQVELPRRFAKYDRVWCLLPGIGWVQGNVQAVDEKQEEEDDAAIIPYVVALAAPHKRLISAPYDRNHCIRPDVCFEAYPDGAPIEAEHKPPARAAAFKAPRPERRPKLRFAIGDRVACLTAGPDGLDWPRRWSSGTVQKLWHRQAGAPEDDAAVPYAVELDTATPGNYASADQPHEDKLMNRHVVVLVHQDEHQYVRKLEFQPPGPCPTGKALPRFSARPSKEEGWEERIDQQTVRMQKQQCETASSLQDNV